MKINGKNYNIPEIDFSIIKKLEEYGVCLLDGSASRSILTVISGFICITTNLTAKQADYIIEQRLLSGEGISDIAEEISTAINKSKFIKQAIDKPKVKGPVLHFKFNNGSELK